MGGLKMEKALIIDTGEVIRVVEVIKTTNNGTIFRDVATGKTYYDREIQIFDDSGVTDFIVMWHPDYHHSDLIGWIDDLHCALDNECDDDKLARIEKEWTASPGFWLRELINLEVAAYRDSLERFYKLQYPDIKS